MTIHPTSDHIVADDLLFTRIFTRDDIRITSVLIFAATSSSVSAAVLIWFRRDLLYVQHHSAAVQAFPHGF